MKALLLRVGKGRNRWADAGFQDYADRLRTLRLEERRLPPARVQGDVDAVRKEEGDRIRGALRPGDLLVVLDERGVLPTTEAFAGWVQDAQRQSTRRLVFAIGGPYGHDPALRKDAWRVLALSRMVLNHELARVMLAEQLYRVNTLLWGGAYHH
ncbi:MAG: 23S rRNA (pseudouridine(1915)-N(3))-methyltransferase RlmH [Myxococcota bacterium]